MNLIRKAVLQDANGILDVYNDSNRIFGAPPQSILPTFEQMLDSESVYLFLNDSVLTGFISYKVYESHVFLSALYVKYDVQRKGFGSTLLKRTEDIIFNDPNCRAIVLKALKSCPWVVSFYQKYGFKIVSEAQTKNDIVNIYFPPEPWEILLLKERKSN